MNLFYDLIENVMFTKGRLQQGLRVLFAVYLIFTFYITVVSRASSGRDLIRTEWLEGYKSVHDVYANSENYLNILLFVPIGCLVGLVANKFRLIHAVLVGLFVSETIECSQLIWQRGTFDVNDLMNNTIGAMVGGLIAVAVMFKRSSYQRGKGNEYA
jgi:glycopeptide antibiotics resistance protein